jgi:2-polyprenyl-6-hydroxyphenyl methylase/3-demethylubiquinone-9 3-methyltransferase
MRLRWHAAQYIELRWWQVYLARRDPASYKAWKASYWRHFLEKCGISSFSGSRVLDAGCGPAGVFMVLENNEVWAVDPLIDRYEESLKHFRRSDYPWVRFEPGRMEQLGRTAHFETVFCLNAINHVADWEGALRNLANAVQPGGLLVLSVDVHRFKWLKRLFRLLPGDVLHPQQHDLNDYKRWFDRLGWAPLRVVRVKREPVFDYYALVFARPQAN